MREGDEKACGCVECRIRKACGFQEGVGDIRPVLVALGNVTAECLAHFSTRVSKDFTAELLATRKKWINHPRVRVQHPEGNA